MIELRSEWEKHIVESLGDQEIFLHDHLGGFDINLRNTIFDRVPLGTTVRTEYLVDHQIRQNYPGIDIQFDANRMITNNYLQAFVGRAVDKDPVIENFICSFFRTHYSDRTKLLCWLHELGWFDPDYTSKNFTIDEYPEEVKTLYTKYIGNDFNNSDKQVRRARMQQSVIYLGGDESRIQHNQNLTSISGPIQKSFVCLVAETHPAQFYPFPTEKFLYPVVNNTLWVAYAPVGYHKFLREKLGFELYTCFDYSFDQIGDHDERIHALTQMLARFKTMTASDWQDIYRHQAQALAHNARYVSSGEFLQVLRQLDETGK